MATPMIVLPLERIFKPGVGRAGAGDERKIDSKLAARVNDTLGPGKSFGGSPFAANGNWHYVRGQSPFNVAGPWPPDLLNTLNTADAAAAARAAPTQEILLDLRNALAHGGIAYLDKDGSQSTGEAAMLAFASFKISNRKPIGLNVLRVSEGNFCAFLRAWTNWLATSDVIEVVNNQGNIAA